MKRILAFTSLALVLSLSPCSRAALPEPVVVDRGPNTKRFERTVDETLPNGRVRTHKSGYTEMAVGMHYMKDGVWTESKELIELFQNGAIGRQAQISVIFAPNIATLGAIDLSMADGKRWRTHVLGVAFFDSANGNSEMVAEVQDSIGELHPPNVVIYPNALATAGGARGDIRFTYQRDRFEQDIILFNRLDLPPGFNAATSQLEVWTEAVDFQEPAKIVSEVDGQTDETLDWGVMRIGEGRAVTLADPQGNIWSAPIYKRWIKADAGRTFLVESVPYLSIKPQLDALPAGQGAAVNKPKPAQQVAALKTPSPLRGERAGVRGRAFPAAPKPAKTGKIQMAALATPSPLGGGAEATMVGTSRRDVPARAAADGTVRAGGTAADVVGRSPQIAPLDAARTAQRAVPTSPRAGLETSAPAGLVLDYSLVLTASNVTFSGDGTYYVAGNLTLSGTTTICGGAVLKYSNSVNTVRLLITGPIDCQTCSSYRPAFLIAKDDDTVGEIISGSTGSPGTNRYAGRALDLNAANTTYTLHDLRIRNADKAIYMSGSGVNLDLSHSQIGNANYAVYNGAKTATVRNCLIHDSLTGINNNLGTTNIAENVTFHRLNKLLNSTLPSAYLTNSLVICVTNNLNYTGGSDVVTNLDDTGIFQTVGAGYHYLSAGSSYRNAGTTNINPTLAADLKLRTTYPPIILTNNITLDTTLGPQAQRDTDLPDLGWHADAIDYACAGVGLTNANLTLQPGTVIAAFAVATGQQYGFATFAGSSLICEGTPDRLNRLVNFATVQEQANTNWSGLKAVTVIGNWLGGAAPYVRVRFTEWSTPALDTYHLDASYLDAETLDLADCQFCGGYIDVQGPQLNVTNCLFRRANTFLDAIYTNFNANFRNCLFYGGTLDLERPGTNTWLLKDNLLDGTAVTTNGTYTADYNGYTTNVVRLPPSGAHDVMLAVSNFTYETGPLGYFYQPTNSALINAGSRNATNAGLFHYTTQVSQAKETNSVVDISFHYIALNGTSSTSTPLDNESDSYFDYAEDFNGNGVFDSSAGETDWKAYNSRYGIGSGPGLVVFTPLK